MDKQNTKLVEAKIRFASEQRFMDKNREEDPSGRLPRGQSKVKGLPVLDLGEQPEIPLEEWVLIVDGATERSIRLTWDDFSALPQAETIVDIHCVTSWSSFDNQWGGVRVADLLRLAGPTPAATHVMLHSADGYTTNVPLADILEDDCLVATSWNGDPLSCSHGGPARLVIPHLYFWKSAKWIVRIEILTKDAPGYWEQRGYHNDGDPWKEQRYSTAPIQRNAPAEPAIAPMPVIGEQAPAPTLLGRISAWIRYHFFPD